MMDESDIDEDKVKSQLKRADHQIFVTLKYTRTVDIIKNIIKRLILAFDFSIIEFLEHLKEKGLLKDEISLVPKARCEMLHKLFHDNIEIEDYVDFYLLLRNIDKSEFGKKDEYRKNVTLSTEFGDVTIDDIHRFYDKTKDFVKFTRDYIKDHP
ncbi:hypothetical protein J4468_04620 [Candidatus Woesearchaeota archaeon]|nr:hypothetical protein [Candidatus Woesearchaeota archaeon]